MSNAFNFAVSPSSLRLMMVNSNGKDTGSLLAHSLTVRQHSPVQGNLSAFPYS